jgi:hypothetical protein
MMRESNWLISAWKAKVSASAILVDRKKNLRARVYESNREIKRAKFSLESSFSVSSASQDGYLHAPRISDRRSS